jgi:HupE / UreJ protein
VDAGADHHGITLALATLGPVHVPSRPVDAAIALSIAFLGAEILRAGQGRPGLTASRPWVAAFAFGLLHGLGFAGALTQLGLPSGEIPPALLSSTSGWKSAS